MRQDVTGFFTMLQGDRARGGMGIRAPARVVRGFGPRARDGVEIQAPGVRWDGDSGPGREVWIRAPGAGWGFGPGRGVGAFWG